MRASDPLPPEIWLIVGEELRDRRDFHCLYRMSRVSKGLSLIALPILYSIHELSPIWVGDTLFTLPKWACLWRSIILSSLGGTLYPYCLWITALRLGNYINLLEDLAKETDYPFNIPALRKSFFSAPLERFHIPLHPKAKATRAKPMRTMHLDAMVAEVASTITEFVKTSADKNNRAVALTSLEGLYLPTAELPIWLSRLSKLTSLTIRDGSVLNASVGQAIRTNCPLFKDVCCYYCKGDDLDSELASFFMALTPNSLETLTLLSMNDLGQQSLAALNQHAGALKFLKLPIGSESLRSLDALRDCTNIETLHIEGSRLLQNINFESEYPGVFDQAVEWLRQCTALKEVKMYLVPSTASLLSKVLVEPNIRLTTLEVTMEQATDVFFASLSHQVKLEDLTILTSEEPGDIDESRHQKFMDAVCNCTELRGLFVDSETMVLDDIVRITQTATRLEDFRFNGEIFDDDFLTVLSQLQYLKQLNVSGPSIFTLDGLSKFIQTLADHPDAATAHAGISILISQMGDVKFTDAQEAKLSREINRLGGRIDIAYIGDPDEMQESDFSD